MIFQILSARARSELFMLRQFCACHAQRILQFSIVQAVETPLELGDIRTHLLLSTAHAKPPGRCSSDCKVSVLKSSHEYTSLCVSLLFFLDPIRTSTSMTL